MGPLKGIKILDLTRLLPGPLCTHLLTRLGAEVVKIEQPGGNGDYVRHIPPMLTFKDGASHGALFEALNSQKKNIVLDLKSSSGVGVLKRLLGQYDIVVEGNRPGVMDRLGVGYKDLKAQNERVIFCSLSGYGASGPLAKRAGHDINYMAIAGLLGLSGPQDTLPPIPGFQAADAAGALQAVIGIQAAIIERMSSGKGQSIDVSLCESAMALAVPSLVEGITNSVKGRGNGFLDGGLSNYAIYETKDGKYLSVGALELHFWEILLEYLRASDGLKETTETMTKERTVALFKSKPLEAWLQIASKLDVCIEEILPVQEVPNHPQHQHRGVFLSQSADAVPDANTFPKQMVLGPRMSNHKPEVLRRAAKFGEHTRSVLSEAGFSPDEIDSLIASKTVMQSK